MAKGKRYNLLKVKMLMIVSQLLLLAFVSYWLYTQYLGEKDQLRKNIAAELKATQQQVTDTTILLKLFGEDGQFDSMFEARTFRSKHLSDGKPVFTMTISDSDFNANDELPIEITELKEALKDYQANGKQRNLKRVKFVRKDGHDISTIDTILPDNGGTKIKSEFGRAIIAQSMKMIVSEVTKIVGDTIDKKLLDVDTNLIKKKFQKLIDRNGYGVDARFVGNYKKHIPNKTPGELYIEDQFFGRTYGMAITNYNTYLFKTIAPQVFFTLFLLALTFTAFLFTYRSLKDQIKLGVIKNDFISNMSHELKTPISTVKVAIEALTSYNMLQDPAKAREYLEMAGIEMDRLEMLVSQALNASLIEGGRITLKKENHDLHKVTEDVCKAMQLRFEQNNATVYINADGNDFFTSVDKLHMQGVLINLLDNSLKYADEAPVIDIHLSKTAGDIKITIADNGPGIPKEYIDKVFDKFFRVPTGDRHNIKGFGLGLSYSQQIMQQHNGSINVYNKPEGGCVFILILPKTN